MKIGAAIDALKEGKLVQRAGRKSDAISLKLPWSVEKGYHGAIITPRAGGFDWKPTYEDLLSEDWEVV